MMGFGPSDARELTYWEYTAMLSVWNARHSNDSDEMPLPDVADVRANLAAIAANPALVN